MAYEKSSKLDPKNRLNLNITPGFRFVVSIGKEDIAAFTECTLPTLEWEVEEIKEGGLNVYVHQLPGRRKSAKVTLKNGVGVSKSLLSWYTQSFTEPFKRQTVTIKLLDSHLAPLLTVEIEESYPVKWTGPQLKSDDNAIAIQTLELACGEITIINP